MAPPPAHRARAASPGRAATGPLGLAAATKLLVNSDRHADDGVFSRDVIDLAMMDHKLPALRAAFAKAAAAYGPAVGQDLAKAIDSMRTRAGWLERCMQAMAIDLPKALLWQKIHALQRVLPTSVN